MTSESKCIRQTFGSSRAQQIPPAAGTNILHWGRTDSMYLQGSTSCNRQHFRVGETEVISTHFSGSKQGFCIVILSCSNRRESV